MHKLFAYKIKYIGTSFNIFLNVLIKNNISIFNAVNDNNYISFYIMPTNFSKFQKLISKNQYEIEKCGGVKFLISQLFKRVGIIVGVLAIFISNMLVSQKILYIKIIGDDTYIEQIKNVLKDNDIYIGSGNKINHEALEKNILESVDRAAMITSEATKSHVILKIENDYVYVDCETIYGKVNDKISVNMSGEQMEIAFNPKYLLEAFKSVDSNEIKIEFSGPLNPVVIRYLEGESFTSIVLPVRLHWYDKT